MGKLLHRYTLVSLTTMMLWFGSQAIRPYIPLRLNEFGASETEIGVAVSSFAFLGLVLAIPFGRLIDRIGARFVALASFPVLIGTSIGYAYVTSVAGMIVVQVIVGIAFMTAWLALQAFIMGAKGNASLSFHIAVFSLGWGIGQTVGPMIGALLYQAYGFSTLAWVVAAVQAVALAVAFWLSSLVARRAAEQPPKDPKAPEPIRAGLQSLLPSPTMKLVVLTALTSISVEAIRNSFYPLYLEQRGYAVSRIGALITVAAICALAVRALLPLLRKWIGAGPLLVASVIVSIVGIAATPALTTYWLLIVGAILMGVGTGLASPISIEMMSSGIASDKRGLAAAIRAMSNRLANLAQPVMFSGFVAAFGMAAAFPVAGAVLGGCCVWMARLVRRADDEIADLAAEDQPPAQ